MEYAADGTITKEKVLSGIRAHINDSHCERCPYSNLDQYACTGVLMLDALMVIEKMADEAKARKAVKWDG